MRVCVVGVGNIGLNLLESLRSAGVDAVGVDISEERVSELAARKIHNVFRSPGAVGSVDAWIITTSTGPGLSHLFAAVSSLSPQPSAIVSVESTLPVGTISRLSAHFEQRGYSVGKDLFLIHVPHRILFGFEKSVFDATRVIGGMTPACLEKGVALYGRFIQHLLPVSDVRIAELAKVVENALRFVEISFAQEVFRLCRNKQMDFRQLRTAVNTKHNVHLQDVDYGIGGECLPKDVRFLNEVLSSSLLKGAIEADTRFREFLYTVGAGAGRVLLNGITYKPGYPNVQHSRAVELALRLQDSGSEVFVNDPLLTQAEVEASGLCWGEINDDYDLVFERPLTIKNPAKEDTCGQDSGHGQ